MLSARHHLLHRPAILALERLQQVRPFFQFTQRCGICIDPFRIVTHLVLEIRHAASHILQRGENRARSFIQTRQLAARTHRLGQGNAHPALAIRPKGRLQLRAQLDESLAVARGTQTRHDFFFLPRLQLGGGNFLGRMGQHVSAQGRILFESVQTRNFTGQASLLAMRHGKGRSHFRRSRVGIKHFGLRFPGKKRLVIMRSVQIDQAIPERLEGSKCARGAIEKLAA